MKKELNKKEIAVCCICGLKFEISKDFWGGNPEPIKPHMIDDEIQICCKKCYENTVIPTLYKSSL